MDQSSDHGDKTQRRSQSDLRDVPVLDKVGPYKVVGVLGRGGMGTVYLAEETDPVRRRVALKVLNVGRGTDRGIARMEAERQALALMNHPSIATVYHAGTTDEGLPFFAMEVVEGQPLIDYCDDHRLDTRERLELFRQICDAVQHAHQKMIIHRDLKPSNVLVTIEEGRAVPKLIDFGIAKCLEKPLSDNASLVTREGLPVGTPLYMSPEQIQGDLIDLDARVDVYALGVLLYELLAGVQPFEVTDSEPIQVMLRVLKEELPRPSVLLAVMEPELQARIAARRRSEAGALIRELRSDLDWIIVKATEKERGRRYGSAAGLRADVDRFLNREPVAARAPSVPYRMARFVRRFRSTVIAVLVILIALIGGLTVATVSSVRATRAKDAALAAERRANATVQYLRKVLSSVDPGVDGRQVRVVDLLTKASEMITSDLVDQPEVEAAVRKTIGLTLLELGIFEESAPQLERTVEIQESTLGRDHPETLHSINAVGRLLYKLGRYEQAATIHRRVFDQQTQLLGGDAPHTLWTMYHLAKALDKSGSWDEAEELYRENVAMRQRIFGTEHVDTLVAVNSMSLFLAVVGKTDEAEALQRGNLEALEQAAGSEHPDTLRARANLAEILNFGGLYAEAEQEGRNVISTLARVLGPEHPETLGATAQLGVALHHQARFSDAEALDRRVLALRRIRLGENHPDTLQTEVNLGLDLLRLGRLEDAESTLQRAVVGARSTQPARCWRTALFEARLGECLREMGRNDEAEAFLLASYEVLVERRHPFEHEVAASLVALYEGWGRDSEAAHYRSLMAQ